MATFASTKHPWVAYQPMRLVYQLACTTAILFRLPLWLTIALVPSLRPRRQWTFLQTLTAKIARAAVGMTATIGITEPVSLAPGPEGDRFELIPPFPGAPTAYTGALAPSPAARPAPVGAVWYPAKPSLPPTAATTSTSSTSTLPRPVPLKIALHVHGGGFVVGQARPDYNGFAATTLLAHAGVDAVLAVSYRLSGYGAAPASNPFPAALQDVLTVYLHLTRTLGVAPAQVVLVGDSAGGNLVLALLRYLEEARGGGGGGGDDDQRPAGAVLVAPWVNPLAALGPDAVYTRSPHWGTDFLPVSLLRWGARTYGGEALRGNPYVTFVGHPFATRVPLLVVLGEAEVLQTDGVRWVAEMQAVAGNEVELHFEGHAPHDTFLLGPTLGWEASITALVRSKLKPAMAKMMQGGGLGPSGPGGEA